MIKPQHSGCLTRCESRAQSRAVTDNWAKPERGEHVFVVLRRDGFIDDPVEAVTGTKAYRRQDRAQAEAARLNDLNAHKQARYFVRLVRLQDTDVTE